MVIDSSVLLAILFKERHASWALEKLKTCSSRLLMSTVNLAEVLIRARDLKESAYDQIKDEVLRMGIDFVPPDTEAAFIVSQARLRFPINLGDCFAYALAKMEKVRLLTIDAGFQKTDLEVLHP